MGDVHASMTPDFIHFVALLLTDQCDKCDPSGSA